MKRERTSGESMASEMTGHLVLFFLLSGLTVIAEADELFYDWTVSYSERAPLGVKKQVIVINGLFPGPLMNTTTNDIVHVNVRNQLTEPFLLTWNGVQQRKSCWEDGVQGTNCPILPEKNWTYEFQVKDQIGSFFYFPTMLFQKAAGGYGPIHINNRVVIPVPFPQPYHDYDILVGDWYNADYRGLRSALDQGHPLPSHPDGILINGFGPGKEILHFQPGATHRLRISNVGLKTSINFRIQGHNMLLVETEGSYTLKQYYSTLDIHVGQSYSVLVTADQPVNAYYMVASSRFLDRDITGVTIVHYKGSELNSFPIGPIPKGPENHDYDYSLNQARSIRWDLTVGAARPNPQGSFHYGLIKITRTIVLQNSEAVIDGRTRYTVNDVSFEYPDTPLKLADYYKIPNVFSSDTIPAVPMSRDPVLGTSVIDVEYKAFIHVVFENTQPLVQTWHIDGYSFWVVGMGSGVWDDKKRSTYNMVDAVSRSTVQVFPKAWTAILLEMDNMGMWNVRSYDEERRYLGQELYLRVVVSNDPNPIPSPREELPIPANVIRCGRATPS